MTMVLVDPVTGEFNYFRVMDSPLEGKELKYDVYYKNGSVEPEVFMEKGELEPEAVLKVEQMWKARGLYCENNDAVDHDGFWRAFRVKR